MALQASSGMGGSTGIDPFSAYVQYGTTREAARSPGKPAPVTMLSFGSPVPQVQPNTQTLSYGGNASGSTPTSLFAPVSSFLQTMSMGFSASDTAGFNGGITPVALPGRPAPAVNPIAAYQQYGQTRTAALDGSTGFMSGLGDRLSEVLGAMGAGAGDAQVTPVAYQQNGTAGQINWMVILGVFGVGLAIYAATKSK